MQTREETRACLRTDRARLDAFGRRDPTLDTGTAWRAVRLLRWAHHHDGMGRHRLARWLWRWNLASHGVDAPPASELGPGLVLLQPLGVTLRCDAGANLTVTGRCTVGAGAIAGRPRLGDDVTLDRGSMVLGGLRIGNGAAIGPGARVESDVADGACVEARPPTRWERARGADA